MQDQQNKTAVLLFTRFASEEAAVKDFAEHFRANELIAGKLISHTVRTIKQSGLPCFIIDSAHQHGNNFGERFTDAIGQVFAGGFDHVIVIGNDCPQLTSEDLQLASDKLQTTDCVIGPASDGGFYLFGICKHAFDKEFLVHAPWESDGLLNFILNYLTEQSVSIFLTETKFDIDTAGDLTGMIRQKMYFFHRLILFIQSVLASFSRRSILHLFLKRNSFLLFTGLRAPPAFNC